MRAATARPRLAFCLAVLLLGTFGAGAGVAVSALTGSTADRSASDGAGQARPGAPTADRSTGPGARPGSADLAGVQDMLDRHAAAVLRGDRAGFLADLDRGGASAGFRSAQAASFDNLAQVPLAAWTYRVAAPVTAGDALARADARYGRTVTIVRVEFGYALRGIDAVPTVHDVWLTLVRHGDRPLIAGDDDLATDGGASWHGPWDFGPVTVYRGRACLLLAHPAAAAQLAALAAVVDAAVPAVTAVWGPGWAQQVAVLVPASQVEMGAVIGGDLHLDRIAAVAVADSDDADDTGGGGPLTVLGQRIVLNPANLAHLTPVGQRIVIQHEITHLATRASTGNAAPTWLVEGFADYVGNLGSGQPVGVAAAELRAEVRGGHVPATLPTTRDFDSGNPRLAAVYEEAWLACRLIAARAGRPGLVRFYRTVAGAQTAPDAAVAAGLQTVLHTTSARFVTDWRGYLAGQLR